MSNAIQIYNLRMPVPLLKRLRAAASELHMKGTELFRLALVEKLDAVEAKKTRDTESRLRIERETAQVPKRGRGRPRTLRTMGDDDGSLAPKALAPAAQFEISEPEEFVDERFAELLDTHAKKITQVLGSPLEKRIRVREAVSAIRREYPITKSELEIAKALEVAVKQELATTTAASPPVTLDDPKPTMSNLVEKEITRTIDTLVGRAIDTDKVRSFGDVPPENDE